MSYNYLNSLTNRLATTMVQELETLNRTQPNQDGDFVIAVCMAPSDYLVSTLLAIWKAGAAYLPLDVSFPTNRIQHIIGESKPILVIHDDNCKFNHFINNLFQFDLNFFKINIDFKNSLRANPPLTEIIES